MRFEELISLQKLDLNIKIHKTEQRIKEFYSNPKVNGKIYVAFSGGKDSTVLLDIVRSVYPNTPAMFVDTGLEFPEIKKFIKTIDNVDTFRPKVGFREVLQKEGYPVISKNTAKKLRILEHTTNRNKAERRLFVTGMRTCDGGQSKAGKLANKWLKKFLVGYEEYDKYNLDEIDNVKYIAPFSVSERCCNIMKKEPAKRYHKETGRFQITGVMASDSMTRKVNYLRYGCNSFEGKIQSQPLGFWREKDIWDYINEKNLPHSTIYDEPFGYDRTGCIFCMFGCHLEKYPNRFQRMQTTHPKLYEYCMNELGLKDVLKYLEIPYEDKWIV